MRVKIDKLILAGKIMGLKKLKDSINDIKTGYSIGRNVSLAYIKRREAYDSGFFKFDPVTPLIRCHNLLIKELDRGNGNCHEQLGVWIYAKIHPILIEETRKEMARTDRGRIRWIDKEGL